MHPMRFTSIDPFEPVRAVGLTLPDVEAATKYDGSPVLKLGGSFLAGLATIRPPSRARSSSEPRGKTGGA